MRFFSYPTDGENGGGELLSSLELLPPLTMATESYEPNVPVARERLQPIGVEVRLVYDVNTFPFDDNSFDLIINRHESYSEAEVLRILKPGGVFITQQVGFTVLKQRMIS